MMPSLSTAGGVLAVCLSLGPARAACPGQNGPIIFNIKPVDPAKASPSRSTILLLDRPEAGGMPIPKPLLRPLIIHPCYAPGSELLAVSGLGPEDRHGRHMEIQLYDLRKNLLEPKTRSILAPGVFFNALLPAWSPEGDQIAYICAGPPADDPPEARELRLLDLTGTRTLAHDLDKFPVAWSQDGRRIAFTRHAQIWLLDLATGKPPVAMTHPGPDGVWPQRRRAIWSPDGQRLAYTRQDSPSGPNRVWLSDLEGKDEQALTDGSAPCQVLDWSPDGQKLLYLRNLNGKEDLWIQYPSADPGAAQARRITDNPPGSVITCASWGALPPGSAAIPASFWNSPAFTRTGATSSGSASASPNSSPSASSSSSSSGLAMASPGVSIGPPSGPQVGMNVDRTLEAAAALAALNPTPAHPMEVVSAASASASSPAPATPGTVYFWRQRYVLSSSPMSPARLEACDIFKAATGMPAQPLASGAPALRPGGGAPPWRLMPSLSGDGRKLAYACLEPDGSGSERLGIRIQDLASGATASVLIPGSIGTAQNGLWPTLSPDGRRLAFLTTDGRGRFFAEASGYPQACLALHVLGPQGLQTIAQELDPSPIAWSPGGDRLFYTHWGMVCAVDVATRRSQPWELPGHRISDLACSPDGKHLALVASKSHVSHILVVDMNDWTWREVTRAKAGGLRRPVWSPDGGQLLFAQKALGRWSLRVRKVQGPADEHILAGSPIQGDTEDLPAAWLPADLGPAAAASPSAAQAATPPSDPDPEPPAKKPKTDTP